jgi:hypothetical protein
LLISFAELKKHVERTILRGFMQNHAGTKKHVQKNKRNMHLTELNWGLGGIASLLFL